LKTYFKKYAFKNTELNDFLVELGKASKQLGIKEDLVQWSYSWLRSSGLNVISYNYIEVNNEIEQFSIHQGIFKYGNNRLRKQKF
jgi:aminopeptidase N